MVIKISVISSKKIIVIQIKKKNLKLVFLYLNNMRKKEINYLTRGDIQTHKHDETTHIDLLLFFKSRTSNDVGRNWHAKHIRIMLL